jgi:hypothetical protein
LNPGVAANDAEMQINTPQIAVTLCEKWIQVVVAASQKLSFLYCSVGANHIA